MKTIYVVTGGCYSDYHIEAMFSTRKLAQEFIAKSGSASNGSIEEWKLDEMKTACQFPVWSVGMMLDNGDVVESYPKDGDTHVIFGLKVRGEIIQCGMRIPCYNDRPIVRTRSSVSAKHALKLAAEARQDWLRKKAEA